MYPVDIYSTEMPDAFCTKRVLPLSCDTCLGPPLLAFSCFASLWWLCPSLMVIESDALSCNAVNQPPHPNICISLHKRFWHRHPQTWKEAVLGGDTSRRGFKSNHWANIVINFVLIGVHEPKSTVGLPSCISKVIHAGSWIVARAESLKNFQGH